MGPHAFNKASLDTLTPAEPALKAEDSGVRREEEEEEEREGKAYSKRPHGGVT